MEVAFAILQNIETDRPPEEIELRHGRHQRIAIAVGKLDAISPPERVEQFLAETLEHALVLQEQVPCSFATLVRDDPGRIILFRPVRACPVDHAERKRFVIESVRERTEIRLVCKEGLQRFQ